MPTQNEPKPPFPPQNQDRPGLDSAMDPKPRHEAPHYRAAGKLKDKAALITGGDSGIGASVAVLFAREGADVAIVYLPEEQSDAEHVRKSHVEKEGRKALLIPGDVRDSGFCDEAVEKTVKEFGKLDILVNNAAYMHKRESIDDVTDEELDKTFRTNIYGYFYMARAALKHMKEGSVIINTGSVAGMEGPNIVAGLRGDEGGDPRLHQEPGAVAHRAEDPRELRGSGTDLDAAERVGAVRGEHGRVWGGWGADGPARAAGGAFASLCVLRFGGRFELHLG